MVFCSARLLCLESKWGGGANGDLVRQWHRWSMGAEAAQTTVPSLDQPWVREIFISTQKLWMEVRNSDVGEAGTAA